jgi:uncharacterized SAM-binding protein YcdF (DUF218 family)
MKRRKIILKILLAGLLAAGLLPCLGLWLAPVLLCVSDPAQKADVIVLLGGEDGSRVEQAAALFKDGWAPHVIVSGEHEMYIRQLIQSGVPEAAIWVDAAAHSTAQNAEFSIRLMRGHGCKSALIVTSWWHTRRARNCFRHFAPDLTFYTQPTHQSPAAARSWGSSRSKILKEYPKNLWYWLRYGIYPF